MLKLKQYYLLHIMSQKTLQKQFFLARYYQHFQVCWLKFNENVRGLIYKKSHKFHKSLISFS